MQQDNTILNKLQQLENQQLPDLSQMDAHWQQMQAMLVPTAKQAKSKRWLWYIIVACIMTGTVLFFTQQGNQPPTYSPSNHTNNPAVATSIHRTPPELSTTVQPPIKSLTVPVQRPTTETPRLPETVLYDTIRKTDTVYFRINFIPCADSVAKKDSIAVRPVDNLKTEDDSETH